MSQRLLIILLIGTAVMFIPIIIQALWYKIKLWKTIPIGILLTVVGTIGTYLMYFFENGYFEGVSFYGAVFLVPIIFVFIAWILRIPYGQLMDLCAPAECVMLVLMKTQCLLTGCCGGRVLFMNSEGLEIRFPSQIAELVNALMLCVILLFLSRRKQEKGYIYPWYLLLYGVTRFILNFFRDLWAVENQIPFGTLWSIISVALGLVCLFVFRKRKGSEKQKNISP